MNLRRSGLVVSAVVAALLAYAPAAWGTAYFGYMSAWEDGQKLAESSGGSIYYEGSGVGRTVTTKITFRDLVADGDGAYGEADEQAWDQVTAPRCCTYYTWAWIHVDQTDRYSKAYGWRTSYMRQSDRDVLYWRVKAKVCVDQNLEPDACGHTSDPAYRQP
jgi:hypothetical protein